MAPGYPFAQLPKYEEFLARLSSMGVKIETSAGSLVNKATGKPEQFQYLSREIDGVRYYASLSFAAPGEIVQLDVLRSVVRKLRLDPTPFGLTLDAKSEVVE